MEPDDTAVGNGQVRLGTDAGGIPLLDQTTQLGEMLGVGDAVPHATQLQCPRVLEDGVNGDIAPRDADVTLVIKEEAQSQLTHAGHDAVDIHRRRDGRGGRVGGAHGLRASHTASLTGPTGDSGVRRHGRGHSRRERRRDAG